MACPTWKLILDYVSGGTYMYRVSDEGSVESRWDNRCIAGVGSKWKPLKGVPCGRGRHLVVTLCGSGKHQDEIDATCLEDLQDFDGDSDFSDGPDDSDRY